MAGKVCLVAAIGLGSAVLVTAEDTVKPPLPELESDRPDFTESAGIVPRGVFQFENGFTTDRDGGAYHFTSPELMLRVGLMRRMELRFGQEGFLLERAFGDAPSVGRSDVDVGTKVRVWGERTLLPAFSVIGALSLPAGSARFSSTGYDPQMKLILAKDLVKGFSFGANLNFGLVTVDGVRRGQQGWSVSLGHELVRGFRGYWEVYGVTALEDGGPHAWIGNSGLTHDLGPNAQFDVRVGRRISGVGPDWFFGVGLVIRTPNHFLFR